MNLSIDEKIGQRFIFGINDNNIDCIIELIKTAYIGGVVLYKKNYSSYKEMQNVISKLKEANKNNKLPLFIATDQEGGKVNRMPSDIHVLKNLYDTSKYSEEAVTDSAKITGKMLYNVGINMNLAPVVDIYNDSRSKVLYKRCFYGNVENVSKNGICYVNELKENNVIPVIKHFPGHGASKLDSHFAIPYVFNYKEVLDKHMKPFKNIVDSGGDAILLGHLVIRKLTRGLPASISDSFIKKYLRDEFKYTGLVMTDELNMLKRNIFYKSIYLKKALISGSDILLIKIKNFDEGYGIINKYKSLILNNHECIKKLDDSVTRVVKLKDKYKISDKVEIAKMKVNEINREIDRINKMIIME